MHRVQDDVLEMRLMALQLAVGDTIVRMTGQTKTSSLSGPAARDYLETSIREHLYDLCEHLSISHPERAAAVRARLHI